MATAVDFGEVISERRIGPTAAHAGGLLVCSVSTAPPMEFADATWEVMLDAYARLNASSVDPQNPQHAEFLEDYAHPTVDKYMVRFETNDGIEPLGYIAVQTLAERVVWVPQDVLKEHFGARYDQQFRYCGSLFSRNRIAEKAVVGMLLHGTILHGTTRVNQAGYPLWLGIDYAGANDPKIPYAVMRMFEAIGKPVTATTMYKSFAVAGPKTGRIRWVDRTMPPYEVSAEMRTRVRDTQTYTLLKEKP